MKFNFDEFLTVLEILHILGENSINKKYLFYLITTKYELKTQQTKLLETYLDFAVNKGIIKTQGNIIELVFPASKIEGVQKKWK